MAKYNKDDHTILFYIENEGRERPYIGGTAMSQGLYGRAQKIMTCKYEDYSLMRRFIIRCLKQGKTIHQIIEMIENECL